MKNSIYKVAVVFLLLSAGGVKAIEVARYVGTTKVSGSFPLSEKGVPAKLICSSDEWPGVMRAFDNFKRDLTAVTGTAPLLSNKISGKDKVVVIAGTIGHNKLIDQLVKAGKINVDPIRGKWESSVTTIVEHPFSGMAQALVIAGSDKRGTIYGIYTLSSQIGVSPWYWWADVPVAKQNDLYVVPGQHIIREPAVKYRGIFLNDEAPALTGWAREKFGNLNHQFYEHVFELILRLKGNYLWPAMWGNAFNDDDKLNPVLADEYGIVMGTSHHEPMQRSQQEWKRYGKGEWNYQVNSSGLREFWRQGIKNMGNKESIVTMAMRGDGDEPMTEGSNIALLEKIVKDQRQIIEEVTKKPASETPQLWALYKEVQDYYDKGMRVPDDVTLLLCDDNWGNIRKVPSLNEKKRSGGYGMYYHFDYVGGPRSYRWLNTNPISKIWEQMNIAYRYGVDRIWVVNVGDLKPMEFPIEFFLDFAWNPDQWPVERLQEYTALWAKAQFGQMYADEIARLITGYTRINGRRKPELLSPGTYSLVHYQEFERAVAEYKALEQQAEEISLKLPSQYRDSFFQLVLHPIQACANLNEMYMAVGKNRMYASQGRVSTNDLAARAKELFERDKEISRKYNKEISAGKWNHMMDQTHIGYVSWDNPKTNVLPQLSYVQPSSSAEMGIALEGAVNELGAKKDSANVLRFDVLHQGRFVEIYNKGKVDFEYTVQTDRDWLWVDVPRGTVTNEQRVWIKADWNRVPEGVTRVPVKINGTGKTKVVYVLLNKAASSKESALNFLPKNSALALDADQYTGAYPENMWNVLPNYGRTRVGVSSYPVTAPTEEPSQSSPHLEYEFSLQDSGMVKFTFYISPSLDFLQKGGLRFGVSIDGEEPAPINIHKGERVGEGSRMWEKSVANSIREVKTEFYIKNAGKHVLRFWRVDPGVVLQKVAMDSGGQQDSYLGPPVVNMKIQ